MNPTDLARQLTMTSPLAQQFLLEPGITFLNHGSFGATPRPVFAAYQDWQRKLEQQPVRFFQRELPDHLAHARQVASDYLGCAAEDFVFVRNPTFAVNTVARSLDLSAGDEILTSNHEYGACVRTWQFLSAQRGFQIRSVPLTLPIQTHDDVVRQLTEAITDKTKVLFLSHITSPTAWELPVREMCRIARERGIVSIIDGAHAPSQIDLDLSAMDADFYTGACHKWLCAPKGASFLYARRECQPLLQPLVVGWGWGPERTIQVGSDFLDMHQWLGTSDLSAYLSVPAAIDFQTQHDWPAVRQHCHRQVQKIVEEAAAITKMAPVHTSDLYHQMGLIELPMTPATDDIQPRLWDHYAIEIPCIQWEDRRFLRVSWQAYNTAADGDNLLAAMRKIL